MSLLFLLFALFILLLLLFCLYRASRNSVLKNTFSLVTNGITLIESFVVTRILIISFGGTLSSRFGELFCSAFKITKEEWVKDSSIEGMTSFLSGILIGVTAFFLLFCFFFIINHWIKRKVFKKVKNVSYKEDVSEKGSKIASVVLGFFSFVLITFSLFYPVGNLVYIIRDSAEKVHYEKPNVYEESSIVRKIANQPLAKLCDSMNAFFFDQITAHSKDKISNTKELKGMTLLFFSLLKLEDKTFSKEDLSHIQEGLETTYLIPSFISELSSNAATQFQKGKSFMGATLEIPKNNSKMLYVDLLEIIRNWERENFVEDVHTVFELWDLLNRNEVDKLEDPTVLMNALAKESFDEELFLSLFHNQDFQKMLPTVINFGMVSIFEKINIKTEDRYVTSLDVSSLSDDDIKEEAKIFSIVMKQMLRVSELKGKKIPLEEWNTMITELNELKKSKLLDDILYDVTSKIVKDLVKDYER